MPSLSREANPNSRRDILQFLFVNGAFQPNPEEVIADLFKVQAH